MKNTMQKKIISIFTVLFISVNSVFFYVPFVNAESCAAITCGDLKSKCQSCIAAHKAWTSASISDFICLNSTNEVEVVLQILLDEKFKEIDIELSDYIDNLDKEKLYSEEDLDGVVSSFSVYWVYRNEYASLCKEGILQSYTECSSNVWLKSVREFLWWENGGLCIQLVNRKMEAYRAILYTVLKLNKSRVRKEARKSYATAQRERYTRLINTMAMVLLYLEKIWKVWNEKIPNPYGCE